MPLPIPKLDDRTFDDLFEEALSLVPAHAPAWTNHNFSDPGITLVELFAWLAEMLVYRADQVPAAHRIAFLRLLNGPEWVPEQDLDDEIARTLVDLRRRWRAVTCEDYEKLARSVSPNAKRVLCVPRRNLLTGRDVDTPGDVSVLVVPGTRSSVFVPMGAEFRDVTNLARSEGGAPIDLPPNAGAVLYVGAVEAFGAVSFAFARPGVGYRLEYAYWDGATWTPLGARDTLEDRTANWSSDGIVSFAPPAGWAQNEVGGATLNWLRVSTASAATTSARALQIAADDGLLRRIATLLDARRILGMSHHVLEPEYVPVSVRMIVVRRADFLVTKVAERAAEALDAFLDPLKGGPDGGGWPFGRPIYVSELNQLLHALPEVEHVVEVRAVPSVTFSWVQPVELWHDGGDQVGLDIGAHNLPEADIDPDAIVVVDRSLLVRVEVTVQPGDGVARATVARVVKEAVRAFTAPSAESPTSFELTPEMLREPIAKALATAGTVVAVELGSDPARMRRDEVLDEMVVRVEEHELVEPATVVTFPD